MNINYFFILILFFLYLLFLYCNFYIINIIIELIYSIKNISDNNYKNKVNLSIKIII